jgi:hypothetical protein
VGKKIKRGGMISVMIS